MNVTSEDIKIAVLSNYRYKKQSICADEVGFVLGNTDISVYQDGILTEIEIKTSKSDMWQGEKAKAPKHQIYKTLEFKFNGMNYPKCIIPNYFYMCVPTSLLDEAKKWVLTTNEKYGILEFREAKGSGVWTPRPEDMVYVAKRPKMLHPEPSPKSLEKIARRLCSANIGLKQSLKSLRRDYNETYKELKELKNVGRQDLSA
jgi:hypothetical protein